jgi:hypothetical protein
MVFLFYVDFQSIKDISFLSYGAKENVKVQFTVNRKVL